MFPAAHRQHRTHWKACSCMEVVGTVGVAQGKGQGPGTSLQPPKMCRRPQEEVGAEGQLLGCCGAEVRRCPAWIRREL